MSLQHRHRRITLVNAQRTRYTSRFTYRLTRVVIGRSLSLYGPLTCIVRVVRIVRVFVCVATRVCIYAAFCLLGQC